MLLYSSCVLSVPVVILNTSACLKLSVHSKLMLYFLNASFHNFSTRQHFPVKSGTLYLVRDFLKLSYYFRSSGGARNIS